MSEGLRHVTLVFPVKDGVLILGMKKRGFGAGKWNGMGGKLQSDETIEAAAVRELEEEIGIRARASDLKKRATLDFYFDQKPEWDQRVHVFLADTWEGTPVESEEMRPQEFSLPEIPYNDMWPDDRHWLPLVLSDKTIEAEFYFAADGNTIIKQEIREVAKRA